MEKFLNEPQGNSKWGLANKISIYVLIAGYLVVNILMQQKFFAGVNIWDKYNPASGLAEIVNTGTHAYFAKTNWLISLLICLICRIKFPLALGISTAIYATLMALFFGFNTVITIFVIVAATVLITALLDDKPKFGRNF